MTVSGELIEVGAIQTFGENSFVKREVVIKTVEEHPQYIKVEFQQKNAIKPEAVEIGDNVIANINLRGRRYEKENGSIEYYNTISGWKIQRL